MAYSYPRKLIGLALSRDEHYAAAYFIDSKLHYLEGSTGELLWKREALGFPVLSPGGGWILSAGEGEDGPGEVSFQALNAAGKKLWERRERAGVRRIAVSDREDGVLLSLEGGRLVLFGGKGQLL